MRNTHDLKGQGGKVKKIYFDMDGTVADLYGTDGWLEKIRSEESGLFENLEPMYDMLKIECLCLDMIEQGTSINVITWTPMFASSEYIAQVAEEKRKWLAQYMPYVSEIHILEYGTPKQFAPTKKAKEMILIDDNKEVCEMWNTNKQRTSFNTNGSDLISLLEI